MQTLRECWHRLLPRHSRPGPLLTPTKPRDCSLVEKDICHVRWLCVRPSLRIRPRPRLKAVFAASGFVIARDRSPATVVEPRPTVCEEDAGLPRQGPDHLVQNTWQALHDADGRASGRAGPGRPGLAGPGRASRAGRRAGGRASARRNLSAEQLSPFLGNSPVRIYFDMG